MTSYLSGGSLNQFRSHRVGRKAAYSREGASSGSTKMYNTRYSPTATNNRGNVRTASTKPRFNQTSMERSNADSPVSANYRSFRSTQSLSSTAPASTLSAQLKQANSQRRMSIGRNRSPPREGSTLRTRVPSRTRSPAGSSAGPSSRLDNIGGTRSLSKRYSRSSLSPSKPSQPRTSTGSRSPYYTRLVRSNGSESLSASSSSSSSTASTTTAGNSRVLSSSSRSSSTHSLRNSHSNSKIPVYVSDTGTQASALRRASRTALQMIDSDTTTSGSSSSSSSSVSASKYPPSRIPKYNSFTRDTDKENGHRRNSINTILNNENNPTRNNLSSTSTNTTNSLRTNTMRSVATHNPSGSCDLELLAAGKTRLDGSRRSSLSRRDSLSRNGTSAARSSDIDEYLDQQFGRTDGRMTVNYLSSGKNSQEHKNTTAGTTRRGPYIRQRRRSISSLTGHHHATKSSRLRALVGLDNLGNTCFMNSGLQCLCTCLELLDYFGGGDYLRDLNRTSRTKGVMARSFAQLASNIRHGKDHSSARPSDLKRAVATIAPQFAGYGQHDSQEFLRFFLSGLHDDVNRIIKKPAYEEIKDISGESDQHKSDRWWTNYKERNDSILTDVFAGQLKSTVCCLTCNNVSTVFDPFMDLSLPIPKSAKGRNSDRSGGGLGGYSGYGGYGSRGYSSRYSRYGGLGLGRGGGGGSGTCSLMDCFKEFTQEETLTDMEQVYCSKCKTHRDQTKVLTVFRFPPVLVVHIKRFSYGAYSRSKLTTNVKFPHDLDLAHLCPASYRGPDPTYKLFGVSNHSGGVGGGHYTAHCNVSTGMEEDSWHTFNDASVYSVTKQGIQGPAAYVLFYRRV